MGWFAVRWRSRVVMAVSFIGFVLFLQRFRTVDVPDVTLREAKIGDNPGAHLHCFYPIRRSDHPIGSRRGGYERGAVATERAAPGYGARSAPSGARTTKAEPPYAGAPGCLLYTSPSPRDRQKSRMPSSA